MHFTPFTIDTWAKQAVDAFLKEGTQLNDTIAKIASENELNPNQIARIVETANHEANHALRKTAKDMRFTFNLAETNRIVDALQHTDGFDGEAYVKAASVSYARPLEKTASESTAPSMFYTRADAYQEPAVRKSTVKIALRKIVEYANRYSADAASASKYAELQIAEQYEKLAQILRPYVLDGGLHKVAEAVHAYYGEDATQILPHVQKVAEKLWKKTKPKYANEADLAALRMSEPPENVPRINGNHPLVVCLDAIKSQEYDKDRKRVSAYLHRMMSNAGITALADVNTNDDVHQYLAEHILRFQDRYKDAPKVAHDYVMANFKEHAMEAVKALPDEYVRKTSSFVATEGDQAGILMGVLLADMDNAEYREKVSMDKNAIIGDMLKRLSMRRAMGLGAKTLGGFIALKALMNMLSPKRALENPRTGDVDYPIKSSPLDHEGVAYGEPKPFKM